MTGVNDIRDTFLSYFKQANHEVVSSALLVPLNDPTLMFVNAGMVPFKNLFTGVETRGYSRAVSSQKCVRAGGKHNDLDNVGYTARHHTFFEMLGNFSFGDYFKEEAIFHAWTLLTETYGLPKDKLLVTVYHTDDQAYDLWKKIAGLSDDRIIRIPTHDNFWSMGDTGPCGPCSEIFFDHGEHIAGGPPGSPDEDGDRFVEIWNLVFMQYEQIAEGNRIDLPKPSIDTGMGLERIAAVLQGTHDNYEIDTFKILIDAASEITGVSSKGNQAPSFKVISDHLRACSFLISDGVLPSNEGRGYVLRRIMRRAMRHAHMLGYNDPLMHQLVPSLVTEMGHAYPSLTRAEPLIRETLKLEEGRFKDMLGRGMKLLGEAVEPLKKDQNLPGDVAFKLYDTFGFPLDLTEDALRADGRGVDVDGFNTCMEKQKAAARAAWTGSGQATTEAVWFDIREEHGATEFLGYKSEVGEGIIQAIIQDGKPIKSAKKGDEVALIINQTPFYAESGGQMGDVGSISNGDSVKITVTDTKKQLGDLHVHLSTLDVGTLSIGDSVEMNVDHEHRDAVRANHSATHLLHEALRRELGDHVTQKGSMVAHDRLRFDIAQPRAVTANELANVERDVNDRIRQNAEVATRLMTPDAAQEEGAMALFGEKYGDEVRVVSMGDDKAKSHGNYSIELCGGTHVKRTGDIGLLKVISESAVSSGVRRIEALTGEAARQYMITQETTLKKAAGVLKSSPGDVADRVEALIADRKSLEKQLAEAKKQLALGGGGSSPSTEVEDIAGVKFHGQVLEGISPKDLRGLADVAKKKMGSGVVALIAVNDGKAGILVGVTDDLTGTHNAVDLVKVGTAALGGKGGGGRPDMAQAGGPNGGDAGKALKAIKETMASI